MAFTVKNYKARQSSRRSEKSASQVASAPVTPTMKAGSKNSNGPKGGSSKSSTSTNRTYKKDNATVKAKAPTVSKEKLNSGVKATPFNRSSRINYRQLKRSK